MPSFTVAPNGQAIVIYSVKDRMGNTPTVYSDSGYSSSTTIPASVQASTTYYLRETPAVVTVKQHDGSTLVSSLVVRDGETVSPKPTDTLISADVSKHAPHQQLYLNGFPTSSVRESVDRRYAVSNMSALTSAVMHSTAIFLRNGDTVTNLTFLSGATAANTPANWWFALYDTASTPALLGQTADQTSTAWAANTAKTVALTSPVAITVTGIYYASVMVKANTPPTLAGVTLENAAAAGAVVTGQKILAQTSGSSLTDTAPATIASATTVATVAYAVAN